VFVANSADSEELTVRTLGFARVIVGRSPMQIGVCICGFGVQLGVKSPVEII
jgi:hypothetical protein